MAFTDLVGTYFQNRMDQATQPFTDPSGYMSQRLGLETEEERRKRLEREAAERGNTEVGSTTVKSYADGSQEEIKKTQIPAPPAAGPVNPNDTYQRMLQAESGNQQMGPNGQIMTSPKGALGAGQVMPATAMDPGYGVPNIFDMAQQQGMPVQARDQATAKQLLGNEQLNRQFGQAYFNGMQNRFGGNEDAAVAAYNAGPGRVGQNMQGGQLNTAGLPQETQNYLQRVRGSQPQAAPAAQPMAQAPAPVAPQPMAPPAQPAPPQAVAPQAPGVQMAAGNTATDVMPTPNEIAVNQITQQAQVTPVAEAPQWSRELEAAQGDSTKLYAIAGNESVPADARTIAKNRALQIDRSKEEVAKAEKLSQGLATGDRKATNELMRELRRKSEEGSYLKAYLFNRLGMTELARSEQEKLAGPKFAQALVDGQSYVVETKGGAVIGAFDQAGTRITDDAILSRINTNYINPTKSETGADVYYNPMQPNSARFSYVRTPTGGTYREVGTNRAATPEEQRGLVKMSSAGPIEQQAAAAYATKGEGQRGKQAAEENVPQAPLPPMSGSAVPGVAVGQPTGVATQPTVTNSLIPNPNVAAAPAVGGSYADRKIGREVGGKRSESFNKIIDTEYREQGESGEVISTNRKLQFDILNRINPATGRGIAEEISGIYNAANEKSGDQKLTILRDILTGKQVPEKEVSERIALLNLTPEAKGALQEYNSLNAQIAGKTLRETAGPGSVSDAEQKANRARNVDIANAPMLGAYNIMSQSQFAADIGRYKSDLSATTTAPNATVFDRDFRKAKTELIKAYREVTEARLDYINKNGGAENPTAIREGYKKYPIPQYDVESGNWRYLKPLDKIFK